MLQGWTLNYKMFFYALFALSLAAPRRLRLAGLAITLGSLAVIHQFVLDALAWAWLRVFPLASWLSTAFFMALALTCCAVAGLLCYRYIESLLTSQLVEFTKRSYSLGRNKRPPANPAASNP